jgi:hypothetical protein
MAKVRLMARGSIGWLCAAVAIAACSTEYNKPIGSRPLQPATGGRASSATGGVAGFAMIPNGGLSSSTGGRAPGEPPGDSALTFVNGVVDAKSVLLCLTTGEGPESSGWGSPFPEGGLDYGGSLVVTDQESLELDGQPFAPAIIAGELELVEGMDCEEALATARAEQAAVAETGAEELGDEAEVGGAGAGGEAGAPASLPPKPRLRVGTLPMLPPETLASGRSLLMVGVGCIGGPAYSAKNDVLACGADYRPERPTLSAVAVRMSRSRLTGRVGFAALHAVTANAPIDVRSAPLTDSSDPTMWITTQLAFGVIAPDPPRLEFTVLGYRANSSTWALQVLTNGSVMYSEPWSEVTERTGITLVDGRNYTVVIVGPSVGLAPNHFWNGSRAVVVDSDPTYVE